MLRWLESKGETTDVLKTDLSHKTHMKGTTGVIYRCQLHKCVFSYGHENNVLLQMLR